eukprot:scaffold299733_cov44-Prasinocladus_malaysianus.AAC.2
MAAKRRGIDVLIGRSCVVESQSYSGETPVRDREAHDEGEDLVRIRMAPLGRDDVLEAVEQHADRHAHQRGHGGSRDCRSVASEKKAGHAPEGLAVCNHRSFTGTRTKPRSKVQTMKQEVRYFAVSPLKRAG